MVRLVLKEEISLKIIPVLFIIERRATIELDRLLGKIVVRQGPKETGYGFQNFIFWVVLTMWGLLK